MRPTPKERTWAFSSVSAFPNPPCLTEPWWATTDEAEAGWRVSQWFGKPFALTTTPGFIMPISVGSMPNPMVRRDSGSGVRDKVGSGPTRASYPYLYQASTSGWLYLLKSMDRRAYFYNYATGLPE
ncbi:hypothetical protein N9D63_05640 [Opitutales bacterium]|nr:hypothetical protein [Opitutales bacterium]